MEHRRAIGAGAGGKEHIAKLRTGRIGDDALDVPLCRRDGRRKKAGRGADEHHDALRDVRCFEHRSEEHTSELQSLMRISYAVFCLKKKNQKKYITPSDRK